MILELFIEFIGLQCKLPRDFQIKVSLFFIKVNFFVPKTSDFFLECSANVPKNMENNGIKV